MGRRSVLSLVFFAAHDLVASRGNLVAKLGVDQAQRSTSPSLDERRDFMFHELDIDTSSGHFFLGGTNGNLPVAPAPIQPPNPCRAPVDRQ